MVDFFKSKQMQLNEPSFKMTFFSKFLFDIVWSRSKRVPEFWHGQRNDLLFLNLFKEKSNELGVQINNFPLLCHRPVSLTRSTVKRDCYLGLLMLGSSTMMNGFVAVDKWTVKRPRPFTYHRQVGMFLFLTVDMFALNATNLVGFVSKRNWVFKVAFQCGRFYSNLTSTIKWAYNWKSWHCFCCFYLLKCTLKMFVSKRSDFIEF